MEQNIQQVLERQMGYAFNEQDAAGNDQNPEHKDKNSIIDYKMVTFSLAGKDYAVDIMKIKEIAKAGRFTYVPNTLPFVLGVYNLRGEIIPIIDLRLFFNIDVPDREDNSVENMLIVTVGEQLFGVVVDAIDKVVGIQKNTIQPPHPLFGDINIKYIYGVVEANRRLYILLDIDRIFGAKNAEEEKAMVEEMEAQTRDPGVQNNIEAQESVPVTKPIAKPISLEVENVPSPEIKVIKEASVKKIISTEQDVSKKQDDMDYNFIVESLLTFKKFNVNELNDSWTKKRYSEWIKLRGKEKAQLQSEEDAEEFLSTFYSSCTSRWWNKQFADSIYKALPENEAKTIVVWNPGCGKGYESYSLACVLKKRYPDARIRIYAHDIDLLNVSNAPLLTITNEAAADWYSPYVTKTVSGEFTFSKDIKDMVLFEYHDCVNTNALPALDIIFARDVISFLSPNAQNGLVEDFKERVKGNGLIVLGENEDVFISGWAKKFIDTFSVYTKQ